MRGKRAGGITPSGIGGLIPACAGKTFTLNIPLEVKRAHPRVCGENDNLSDRVHPASGSSPRVRGKRGFAKRDCDCGGLIPACAGKTATHFINETFSRAHPRVCGENFSFHTQIITQQGSSPRVRGKRQGQLQRPSWSGLIPACAGKTRQEEQRVLEIRAHPRVCGENGGARRVVDCGEGSSPRVRGKPTSVPMRPKTPRLIPACAGKTVSSSARLSRRRAHPRVCGENFEDGQPASHVAGSSPRVRGKPGFADLQPHQAGLIPACAGKTMGAHFSFPVWWAHPRVCGENLLGLIQGH